MSRAWAVALWDLQLGLQNRLLHVLAAAGLAAGFALWALAPDPDPVAMLLLQVLLFFGSLFALLMGWASGQQARGQGAFLFAQPVRGWELVLGKLLAVAVWCAGLLVLVTGPVAVGFGLLAPVASLAALAFGLLLVAAAAGLVIGIAARAAPGLLGALGAWAVAVAGWEVGLIFLADVPGIADVPAVFVGLLLLNPVGAFRVAAMVGLEAVPFDTEGLGVWGGVFDSIGAVAAGLFALWLLGLVLGGAWTVRRQEF